MVPAPGADKGAAPRRPSRALLLLFHIYLYFFFRRHFHALRIAGAHHWQSAGRPLVVCLNHPSWWDPLASILLSRFLARKNDHYAPIDTRGGARYGVLRKLGLFDVEQGTPRGATQFLRGAAAVLAQPGAVLWVTPQGRFTDVRSRPAVFRPGLEVLLSRYGEITVLPLALEYVFWDERLPEAIALLGEPVVIRNSGRADTARLRERIESALTATQDELAALSARRDAAPFQTVMAGRAGTSGIYGGWQRLRAAARGEQFHAEHASLSTHANPAVRADRG